MHVFGMRKDAASTTASKCITMRHATYASRGECINMKRTFWMHENAKECNISRMQQVKKCIKMTVSHRKNAAAQSGCKMRSNATDL
jgi:hypothetical protein